MYPNKIKVNFRKSSPYILTVIIVLSLMFTIQNFTPFPKVSTSLQTASFNTNIIKYNPKLATRAAQTTSSAEIKKNPETQYTPQSSGRQLRVPILMYHYIGDNPNPQDTQRDSLSVSPTKFAEQMKYLQDNNYNTITLDVLYPALKGQISLPSKPVILTFDDGYMDFYYNAYPIIKQYNIHATSFIPTGLINQGYYLTWAQIKEMAASSLITYGAHTVHHPNLTALSIENMALEISESKKVLESQLGVPINFFAYPFGITNNTVIGETQKAGFLGAVGTWANTIQAEGTIYNMPRIRIGGSMNLQTFEKLL